MFLVFFEKPIAWRKHKKTARLKTYKLTLASTLQLKDILAITDSAPLSGWPKSISPAIWYNFMSALFSGGACLIMFFFFFKSNFWIKL